MVLIHTTAGPDWSDFCYSGLYVEALQRMIALSAGIGNYKPDAVLPPMLVMDGFGKLQPPDRKSVISAVDILIPLKTSRQSPATPPGPVRRQAAVPRLPTSATRFPQMRALQGASRGALTESYAVGRRRA